MARLLAPHPRHRTRVLLNLSGSVGAKLSGANLFGADLSGAHVSQTQLDEAACMDGVKLPPGLNLKPCNYPLVMERGK
jgi:uncharacterized protein YjbI with pentapeptide repeats